jgi:DNA-binding NarL/FixJ family response regulator
MRTRLRRALDAHEQPPKDDRLTTPSPIRVALVNDYEIVLEGLRAFFDPHEPEFVVVETDVNAAPREKVDVTLFDTYGAQDSTMLDRVRRLTADPSNGAVLIFSFSDQPDLIEEVVRAGARGFVSKAAPAPAIVRAVREAASGRQVLIRRRASGLDEESPLRWPGRDIGLSGRESELLALLPSGLTNKELASHLFVSENTIKTQLRHLYAKLGVKNRVQAANRASGLLGTHHERQFVGD